MFKVNIVKEFIMGWFRSFGQILSWFADIITVWSYSHWALFLVFMLAIIKQYFRFPLRFQKTTDKDELRLEINPSEHLIGRENDIRKLLGICCQPGKLVFIQGEPGVGKSALIKAGLLPALKDNPTILPIYMATELPKHDSIKLTRYLCNLIFKQLPQDKEVNFNAKIDKKPKLQEIFEALKTQMHQMPLLIFDQFDDYQASYPDKFYSTQHNRPSTTAELCRNHFWAAIDNGLKNNLIACVFVVRDDIQDGLSCVDFVLNTNLVTLKRLPESCVNQLMNQLTKTEEASAIIKKSIHNWHLLREQLQSDLAKSKVLPIQMQWAFWGIRELPELTVKAYQTRGGLVSLESAYLAQALNDVACKLKVKRTVLRALLLALVDASEEKTLARSVLILKDLVPHSSLDEIKQTLAKLADKQLVRQSIDDTSGEVVWKLHHDYLVQVVLHWSSPFYKRFRMDFSAFRKNGFGFQWLPQWFRDLDKQHKYVLFTVLISAILLPLAIWIWHSKNGQQDSVTERAAKIFDDLGTEALPELSENEWQAIWILANSDEKLKKYILRKFFFNKGTQEQFKSRPAMFLRASIGLNADMRLSAKFVGEMFDKIEKKWEPALVALIKHLEPESAGQIAFNLINKNELEKFEVLPKILGKIIKNQLRDRDIEEIKIKIEQYITNPSSLRHLNASLDIFKELKSLPEQAWLDQVTAHTIDLIKEVNCVEQPRDWIEIFRKLKEPLEKIFLEIIIQVYGKYEKQEPLDSGLFWKTGEWFDVFQGDDFKEIVLLKKLEPAIVNKIANYALGSIKITEASWLNTEQRERWLNILEKIVALNNLETATIENIVNQILQYIKDPKYSRHVEGLFNVLKAIIAINVLRPEKIENIFKKIIQDSDSKKKSKNLQDIYDIFKKERANKLDKDLNIDYKDLINKFKNSYISPEKEVLEINSDDAKPENNSTYAEVMYNIALETRNAKSMKKRFSIELIINEMESAENSKDIGYWLKIMEIVSPLLDKTELFNQLLNLISTDANLEKHQYYAKGLKILSPHMEKQALINVLKNPFCVEQCAVIMLEALEQNTPHLFEENLWKMVDWAETQKLNLSSDLTPPEPTKFKKGVDFKNVDKTSVIKRCYSRPHI